MRNRRRRAGRSRRSGSVTAVAVGLVLAVLLAEAAARIAYPRWTEFNDRRFQEHASIEGRRLTVGKPGFDGWFAQNNGEFRVPVRLNAAGLRNDDPVEAADGRLWAVGDAFTFGWGVPRDETFAAIAAAKLGWDWYDIASPIADLEDDRALVRRIPAGARPRAVVLGLSVEDDLRLYPTGPDATRPSLHGGWLRAKHVLIERSAFYNLIVHSLKRMDRLNRLLTDLRLIEPANQAPPAIADGQLAAVLESSADEVARLRTQLGPDVPLTVLLIPARAELRDGDPQARSQRQGIAERLTARGIAVVDPFDSLAPEGIAQLHFPHDGHWSPLAHRLAGEALARALAQP